MPFNYGDVILARFPFTDQLGFKQRPAVVVSNRTYNDAKPDLILMPITSQLRAIPGFGEVWIIGWQAANLLKPSAVKPIFMTLEQPVALKQLGSLQPADQSGLRAAIALVLG